MQLEGAGRASTVGTVLMVLGRHLIFDSLASGFKHLQRLWAGVGGLGLPHLPRKREGRVLLMHPGNQDENFANTPNWSAKTYPKMGPTTGI